LKIKGCLVYFFPKKLGFGSSFCKNFGKNMVILHFRFWPQEKKKKTQKEPQEVPMRIINSVFWMELKMTLKIFVFCISSLQSS
jgi:hypothetical protein